MKKKIICAVKIMLLCSVFFVNCSKDNDDLYEEDSLSIELQIPLTRSGSEDGVIVTSASCREVPVYEDECALYTLAKLKNNYNEYNTASDFYDKMKKYACENYGYTGGAMNMNVMLEVGKHFNLLSGYTMFNEQNSSNTSSEYFSEGNKPKAIYIEGHYAKFMSYNKKTGKVKYLDSTGTVTIDVNQVLGVMYK